MTEKELEKWEKDFFLREKIHELKEEILRMEKRVEYIIENNLEKEQNGLEIPSGRLGHVH